MGLDKPAGQRTQQPQQWVCAHHAAVHSQGSSSGGMPGDGPGDNLQGASSSSSSGGSRGGALSRQQGRQQKQQLRACANCPVVLQQAADSWCEVHEAPCTVLIGGRRVSKPGRHFAGSGTEGGSTVGPADTATVAAAVGAEVASGTAPVPQPAQHQTPETKED
jgi:hypothetical protein